MSQNVLMIGLDGATFDLLDPLIEQGVMPFVGSVLKNAVRANLMSTRHPLTPPAWTSMITGRSPTAHGIYDFLRPAFLPDGSVYLKINDYRDNHCETIWSIAIDTSGGRRALISTACRRHLLSTVTSFRLHSVETSAAGGTYPKELLDDVRALPNFDFRVLGMDHRLRKRNARRACTRASTSPGSICRVLGIGPGASSPAT